MPYEYKFLGKNAFKNCNTLSELEFDRSICLEKIGEAAFYKTGIRKLCFAKSTISLVLDKECFYECENLQEIIFSQNIVGVGESAFFMAGKNTQQSVILQIPPKSALSFVGDKAFYGSLITNCSLVAYNLEQIGDFAFYNSDFLSIELDNIIHIGNKAFYPRYAPAEINLEKLPNITRNLDKIVLGESLKHIGSYNFCFVNNLNLPNKIEYRRSCIFRCVYSVGVYWEKLNRHLLCGFCL